MRFDTSFATELHYVDSLRREFYSVLYHRTVRVLLFLWISYLAVEH